MDTKRFFLLLRKRWYTVILALIAGALLGGIIYQIYYVQSTKEKVYSSRALFYITCNNKSAFDYYNSYTWGDVVKTENILGRAYEEYSNAEVSPKISKSEFASCVNASILSDLRILVVEVKAFTSEQAEAMIQAYAVGICEFPQYVPEFDSIERWSFEDTQLVVKENLIAHAVRLGLLLGFVCWLIIYMMYYAVEGSICTENDLKEFKEIPFLGYESKKQNEILNLLCKENLQNVETSFGAITRISLDNMKNWSLELEKAGDGGIVLEIPFHAHNQKKLQYFLNECKNRNRVVRGFVITEADDRFLKDYYYIK